MILCLLRLRALLVVTLTPTMLHIFVLAITIRFTSGLIIFISTIPAGKDVLYLIEGVIDFLPIEKNKSVGVPMRSIKSAHNLPALPAFSSWPLRHCQDYDLSGQYCHKYIVSDRGIISPLLDATIPLTGMILQRQLSPRLHGIYDGSLLLSTFQS